MKLNERQIQTLKALRDLRQKEGYIIHQPHFHARWIARCAFPDSPFRNRADAGMTRTLDALCDRGQLVMWKPGPVGFGGQLSGREWRITQAGLDFLDELESAGGNSPIR